MTSLSLKRIQTEYNHLIKDPPETFIAHPLKDDLFNWHFTIKGADETEFESGYYHGVIKLPTNYPLKPPSIMFLTPNGRFDVNMDVCLSVTKYHKEDWQPAWTIRTILEAIIAFFPVKEDHSAIGAIDYPIEIRKRLAHASQKWNCDVCGCVYENFQNFFNKNVKKVEQAVVVEEKKEDDKKDESQNSDHRNDGGESRSQKSKEDNNSDISADVKPIFKKIKKYDKKSELDKRSHNIEGIIFEDIREEEEIEEGSDKKAKGSSNESNNLEQETNQNDFNEVLRKLRIKQFKEAEKTENHQSQNVTKSFFEEDQNQFQENQNVKINHDANHGKLEHDLLNQKGINKNLFFTYKKTPNVSQIVTNYDLLKKTLSEEFRSNTKEEEEFYEVSRSLKVHKSEITDNIKNELKNNLIHEKQSLLGHENSFHFEEKLQNENEILKEFLHNLEILKQQKQNFEEIYAKKAIEIKILTKKSYENSFTVRMCVVHLLMLFSIILAFSLYYGFRNRF